MGRPQAETTHPFATITTPAMTAAGIILGTAAYMSPEQAKGKPADKRSDIWAFGCVLYEMLTGRRAFRGETVADTLAAVLVQEPSWEDVPPQAARVLQRCLAKDPRRRWRDVADAIVVLESEMASLGVAPAAPGPADRHGFFLVPSPLPWAWPRTRGCRVNRRCPHSSRSSG